MMKSLFVSVKFDKTNALVMSFDRFASLHSFESAFAFISERFAVFIVAVLLFTSSFSFGQNYYSTTTKADTYLNMHLNAVTFRDKHFIVVEEYCHYFVEIGCAVIMEALPDGHVIKRKDIGQLNIGTNAVTVAGDTLNILGKGPNNTMTIVQYNSNLEEINRKNYPIDEYFWAFGIVHFGDYLVVTLRNKTGQGYFDSFIYWISKDDLEIVEVISDVSTQNSIFCDMEIDHSGLLNIMSQKGETAQLLKYDLSRDLIGSLAVPTNGYIPYADFEFLDNHNIVYGLEKTPIIRCIDPNGRLVWQTNIAVPLGVAAISYIRALTKDHNGNILISGDLLQTGRKAFITKISSEGEILYSLIYIADNAAYNRLAQIIETEESDILFIGSTKYLEVDITSAHNYYWILKTNANGTVTDTTIFENKTYIIYPNPVERNLSVFPFEKSAMHYSIVNIFGTIMLEGIIDNSIDVQQLPPGAYFLKIWDKMSASFTSMFIKA